MGEVVRRMCEGILILTRTNFCSDSITFRLGWSDCRKKVILTTAPLSFQFIFASLTFPQTIDCTEMWSGEGRIFVQVRRAPNTDRDLSWEFFWLKGFFLSSSASLFLMWLHGSPFLINLRGKPVPKNRKIDWEVFWLREVLFLALPALSAVAVLPKGGHIHTARVALLIVIQLCLTMFNVYWARFRPARH
jgi:hypothetical protein